MQHNSTMTGPRFFVDSPLHPAQRYELPVAVAQHVRVLRLEPGEVVTLFDGGGRECRAELHEVSKRQVVVEVGEGCLIDRESPLSVTLVQALQAGDRMDFTLQKAVELGVSVIVPVQAARSVTRLKGDRAMRRSAHWQRVVESACEQCGRNILPVLSPVASLGDSLTALPAEGLRLVLHPEAEQSLRGLAAARQVVLLIGPEGGFEAQELAMAEAAGFTRIAFGPRILRTETAGPAALAAIQTLWGDMG